MSNANIVVNISLQINRYVPIPVFVFGLFGNILNIAVFTRPLLRKNPCSIYFMCASIANLSVLFFGLIFRFLADAFGIDLVSRDLGFCRFRYFILHSSMVLSLWFTTLASIDRYCISSRNVHRRQLSNLKYARYTVVLTICTCLGLYSHALGLFTVEQLKSGPYCYAHAGTYRIFYDFFYFATYSFTPPIVMIIVGLGTFYNVHQIRAQVGPTTIINNGNAGQLRKRDRQLITMVLVQVIFTVFLTLPLAIQKLYATFTQDVIKSSYQTAIESLITTITRMFVFINSSTSFFVFTLSGSAYRKDVAQIMNKIIGVIFGKNSSVYRQFQKFSEPKSNMQSMPMNRTITTVN